MSILSHFPQEGASLCEIYKRGPSGLGTNRLKKPSRGKEVIVKKLDPFDAYKIIFLLSISVSLVGAESPNEGDVYAFNPDTETFGPICEDTWDKLDVRIFRLV